MINYVYQIIAILLCVLCFSCKENVTKSVILLKEAEEAVNNNPKMASQLLDSIIDPNALDIDFRMQYYITKMQANYKYGKDIITDSAMISKAISYFEQEGNEYWAMKGNLYKGLAHYETNNYESALLAFLASDKLARKINNTEFIGLSQYNIGNLYYEQEQFGNSIDYFKKAYIYFDKGEVNDKYKLQTLNMIGRAFEAQGILDSAYHYFDKGLSQANNLQNKTYQTIFTHNQGIVFLGQKRYKEASQYMLSALEGTTNIQDSIRLRLNLSRVYYQTNQLDSAEYHKAFVLNRIDEINNPYTLVSIYSHLSDYYSQIGNDKQALYYKEQQRKTEAKIAQANQADKLITAETNHKLYIQKQEQKAKRTQELLIQAIIILVIIAVYYFATTKRRNKYKQEKIRNQWLRAENRLLKQEYESHVYLESIYKEFILKWHQIENDLSKNGIEESPHVNNPLYYEIKPMIDDLKSKSNEQLVKMATKYFYSHNDSDIGDKAVRTLTEQELMLLMLCYLEYSQAAIATILDIRLERLDLEERKERIRARLQKIGMSDKDIDFLLHS